MLELRNVSKSFGNKNVLNDISLNIENNKMIGIIGHSGSGKSTLLNCIYGILEPNDGYIIIDGDDIRKKSDADLSSMRNNKISYVFQGQSLLQNLTVRENILSPSLFGSHIKANVDDIMNLLMISDIADSYPYQISGGEMKRCAIARSIIMEPNIILADEPTSDLDPESTKIIMNVFRKYVDDGHSIVIVTHDMQNLNFCDTVYKMENGRLEMI